MIKLIYLTHSDINEYSGVSKKILSQISAFKNTGFICDIFYKTKTKNKIFKKLYNSNLTLQEYSNNLLNKIRLICEYKIIYNYILKEKYEIVYLRYALEANPFFIKFLKNLKRENIKIILEIPTYPYDNERISKNILRKIYIKIEKIYRKKLKNNVDRIVTFSNDNEIFGIKTIKMNNGIDVLQVPIINEEKNYNIDNEINFIGVARIALWHGFDRLILSMFEYYKNNPKEIIKFHVVGDGQKDVVENLKRLVRDNNLEKYVIFYGYKSGKELDKIYEKIDIGIGNLGNFRKGLIDGGGLKNQEYCAKGLPFIIAGYDDNYKNVDFMYKISADESLINLNKIIDWYKNLQITPEQIRKYVEDNLTWDIQMKKVVDYILETEEIEKC